MSNLFNNVTEILLKLVLRHQTINQSIHIDTNKNSIRQANDYS